MSSRLAAFLGVQVKRDAAVEYDGAIYRAVPQGWKPVPSRFDANKPPTGYTIEIPFE